jgi:hypothetical protein
LIDMVGDGGYDLAAPAGGQLSKKSGSELSSDICEGVAVEEEEWGAPMAAPEEI